MQENIMTLSITNHLRRVHQNHCLLRSQQQESFYYSSSKTRPLSADRGQLFKPKHTSPTEANVCRQNRRFEKKESCHFCTFPDGSSRIRWESNCNDSSLVEKVLVCCTERSQRNTPAGRPHCHTNEFFNRRDAIMEPEAICHPLICTLWLFPQTELSVKLQRKWSCSRNRRWWLQLLLCDEISAD